MSVILLVSKVPSLPVCALVVVVASVQTCPDEAGQLVLVPPLLDAALQVQIVIKDRRVKVGGGGRRQR